MLMMIVLRLSGASAVKLLRDEKLGYHKDNN
jgi:hypothetical protein